MAKSVTITLSQLKAAGACKSQRDLFVEKFGDSVTFHKKSDFVAACLHSSQEFNFAWAGMYLLSGSASLDFHKETRISDWNRKNSKLISGLEPYEIREVRRHDYAAAFANAYWSQSQ